MSILSPKVPVTKEYMSLPEFMPRNQWVYWASFQSIGEGLQEYRCFQTLQRCCLQNLHPLGLRLSCSSIDGAYLLYSLAYILILSPRPHEIKVEVHMTGGSIWNSGQGLVILSSPSWRIQAINKHSWHNPFSSRCSWTPQNVACLAWRRVMHHTYIL